MSRKLRRRLLIVIGLGALLNAAVYGTYTLPRSLQERWLSSRRATLQGELERERGTAAALRSQTDTARSNAADVGRFYGQVVGVRTASMVPVLREVEALAREGGLHPGGATYAVDPVKGGRLERFAITMPVEGNYRQLVSFVERLEQSSYFLTLDQVKVTGSSRGGHQVQVQLDLVLSCYFRLPGRPPEPPKQS